METLYRDSMGWIHGRDSSSIYSVNGENKTTGETETKFFRSYSDADSYGKANLK